MDWNLHTTMARDPVCWMMVDPATAPKVEHGGETYYFCSRGCQLDFQDEPERYLDPAYKPEGGHDMGGHGG
jgi:YHS domain-containing protein